MALERARYEEKRARRQFDAVEPENRLVAGELEARWNGALAQVAEAEARLAAMAEECGLPTDVAAVFTGVRVFVEEVLTQRTEQ